MGQQTMATPKTKKSKTTKTSASTRKRAAPKSAKAKFAAAEDTTPQAKRIAPAAPKTPVVVAETTLTKVSPPLRKQDLLEKVSRRSGTSKRDAKPVIEAMLALLGEALDEGRELNLEPLGKVKVKRAKDLSNAKVSIVKVRRRRQSTDNKDQDVSLAPAAE